MTYGQKAPAFAAAASKRATTRPCFFANVFVAARTAGGSKFLPASPATHASAEASPLVSTAPTSTSNPHAASTARFKAASSMKRSAGGRHIEQPATEDGAAFGPTSSFSSPSLRRLSRSALRSATSRIAPTALAAPKEPASHPQERHAHLAHRNETRATRARVVHARRSTQECSKPSLAPRANASSEAKRRPHARSVDVVIRRLTCKGCVNSRGAENVS